MKRFKFSLQSILDIRIGEEDMAKRDVAEKEQELYEAKVRVGEVQQALKDFQKELKEKRNSFSNIIELKHSVTWRDSLKSDLLTRAQQMQEIEMDLRRAKEKLIEAVKKRKGLEILRDKQYEEWKKEMNRKEQIFLDELASNGHIRKNRNDKKNS